VTDNSNQGAEKLKTRKISLDNFSRAPLGLAIDSNKVATNQLSEKKS